MMRHPTSRAHNAPVVLFTLLALAAMAAALITGTAMAEPPVEGRRQEPQSPLASFLTINEVYDSSNVAFEYFELYNASITFTVDLTGYVIYNRDGTNNLSRLGVTNTLLPPRGYKVISPRDLGSTTLSGSGLASTDFLGLVNSALDSTVDLVNWGNPPNPGWVNFQRFQSDFFYTGIPPMPAPDGPLSLSRYPNGQDTDTGLDWRQLIQSPGRVNGGTPFPTPTGFPTPVPSWYPSPIPTACTISFTDVHPWEYFYEPVRHLFCAGAVSGYVGNTYRPFSNTTRAQLSKIVVLAERWEIDVKGGPHFRDVPESNPFYGYIETAYNSAIISGYTCGGPGEPCPGLYFRWGSHVTRSQLSKIVVLAERWPANTAGGPHFTDVPTTSPFYGYIETAYNRGIISGYADGTFRPGYTAMRGQIAKIVHGAVTGP